MSELSRPEPTLSLGRIVIWLPSMRLSDGLTGTKVALQEKDALVLFYLLERKNQMVERTAIASDLYGHSDADTLSAIMTHLSSVRSALNQASEGADEHLWTENGKGRVGIFDARQARHPTASA